MPPSPHRGKAFTLVELLAATALSAVLLMGLLAVTVAVARPTSDPTRRVAGGQRRGHVDAVMELLARDLSDAVEVTHSEGVLQLRGYGGLDPVSLRPTHRPALVTYHSREAGGQWWLVRTQVNLDELSNNRGFAHLVCQGVSGLDLGAVTERQEHATDEAEPPQEDQGLSPPISPGSNVSGGVAAGVPEGAARGRPVVSIEPVRAGRAAAQRAGKDPRAVSPNAPENATSEQAGPATRGGKRYRVRLTMASDAVKPSGGDDPQPTLIIEKLLVIR